MFERPSGLDVDGIEKALQVVFSCPEQVAQAMERPDVLKDDQDVTVVDAVACAREDERLQQATEATDFVRGASNSSPARTAIETVNAVSSHIVSKNEQIESNSKRGLPAKDTCVPSFECVQGTVEAAPGMQNRNDLHYARPGRSERALQDAERNRHPTNVLSVETPGLGSAYVASERSQLLVNMETEGQGAGHSVESDVQYESLCESSDQHTTVQLRSGVKVHKDDVFIMWSQHIHKCDDKEQPHKDVNI